MEPTKSSSSSKEGSLCHRPVSPFLLAGAMTVLVSVSLDLITVVPLISWAVVGIVAIAIYAQIGWVAPTICAGYTTCIGSYVRQSSV